jgi:hypothetical protein
VVGPLAHLQEVVVVGRGLPGGLLAGLVQRPTQHRRALVREVAGSAPGVGLVEGDVQAGVADSVVGACEAAAVAELGEDRGRADRPDPVQALAQRAAAGLPGGERAQLPVERHQLQVEHVEHAQGERDELAAGRGKLDTGERRPAGRGCADSVQPARVGVHKSGSCREAVFVDQSAQAISKATAQAALVGDDPSQLERRFSHEAESAAACGLRELDAVRLER